MKILGIETSCDDTAAAVITDNREILSNVVLSQLKQHAPYGGVVPEIAARAHIDVLDTIIKQALQEANLNDFNQLDAIAVTQGPGLIGGVIVGVMFAKAIASVTKLPLLAVNHLEGHALTARLTDPNLEFPFLLLLVSGGHCQILGVAGVGKYKLYGKTIDDALGECFDKVAKMQGLGYPGGPIVEQLAKDGDPSRFNFPRPLKDRNNCDFSFSGLKTAVKRQIDLLGGLEKLNEQDKHDICASFQRTIAEILDDKINNAIALFKQDFPNSKTLVIAGGVAANQYLKNSLVNSCATHGFSVVTPPIRLCTDNAAMIAWAGIERFKLGIRDDIKFVPMARMPLVS